MVQAHGKSSTRSFLTPAPLKTLDPLPSPHTNTQDGIQHPEHTIICAALPPPASLLFMGIGTSASITDPIHDRSAISLLRILNPGSNERAVVLIPVDGRERRESQVGVVDVRGIARELAEAASDEMLRLLEEVAACVVNVYEGEGVENLCAWSEWFSIRGVGGNERGGFDLL